MSTGEDRAGREVPSTELPSAEEPVAVQDMPEPQRELPETAESVAFEVEPLGGDHPVPLPADPPPPPSGGSLEELVDGLDEKIRRGGPEEVRQADEAADAVENEPDKPSSGTDSDQDPTSEPDVAEPPS